MPPRKRRILSSPYDGLSLRHKRFVQEYLKDGNATAAAIRCGYSKNTACNTGYIILKKEKVRAALSEFRKSAAVRAEISVEKVLRRLEDLYSECITAGDFKAATKVLELQGKTAGMFVDRIDIGGNLIDILGKVAEKRKARDK